MQVFAAAFPVCCIRVICLRVQFNYKFVDVLPYDEAAKQHRSFCQAILSTFKTRAGEAQLHSRAAVAPFSSYLLNTLGCA
jgi:hypothetical protein